MSNDQSLITAVTMCDATATAFLLTSGCDFDQTFNDLVLGPITLTEFVTSMINDIEFRFSAGYYYGQLVVYRKLEELKDWKKILRLLEKAEKEEVEYYDHEVFEFDEELTLCDCPKSVCQ